MSNNNKSSTKVFPNQIKKVLTSVVADMKGDKIGVESRVQMTFIPSLNICFLQNNEKPCPINSSTLNIQHPFLWNSYHEDGSIIWCCFNL